VRAIRGLLAAALIGSVPAAARTLTVGSGRDYKLPSEAFAAAHDGDTILIGPGEYFDCAIVRSNDLTIVGEGAAVMTDKVCEEKAILVLRGNNVTIRNLTLKRARVPDSNGAGVRLESPNLTIDHVRFDNDQVGILSGIGGGRVTITDSLFDRGGVGGVQGKYAIMIAQSSLLRVANCSFTDLKGGQIATAATRSEITGNTIALGAAGEADEEPTYAVIATQGELLMDHNVIAVGPNVPRPGTAIGVWDDASAKIRQTHMTNTTGTSLALLKDWSSGETVLQDNRISPGDTLVSSSGIWRHRASTQYYARKKDAHAFATSVKQMIKHALGR
jgi:hypothetical protein